MKTAPMCFSIFEVPRSGIHTLAHFGWESLHHVDRTCRSSSSFRSLISKANGLEGGYSRRWIGRPASTKIERKNENPQNSKRTTIRQQILDEAVSTSAALSISETKVSKFQICDIEEKIAENQDLSKLVNGSEGMSSSRGSMLSEKGTSNGLKNKGKLIPLAVQATTNAWRKEGYSRSDNIKQKGQLRVKSNKSVGRKTAQQRILKKPNNVLRPNNLKQNSVSNRDGSTLKNSSSNQEGNRVQSTKSRLGPSRTLNKVVVKPETTSRKMDSEKERTKSLSRKRPASTKIERKNENPQKRKRTTIRQQIVDEAVSTSAALSISETKVSKFQIFDIEEKIADNQDLSKPVTVIVFDTETTGFSRENDRIIEIALQDLDGGENSTFQTLINPERYVPNSHVHGITTNMVCRPGVPRMEELIPILLQYVKSRQKPGGYILFVAHNARSFDVPFLVNEFTRCSVDFPANWMFLDSLILARELLKSEGLKVSSGTSLQDLRKKYDIPLLGSAHRAMADVRVLSLILQRLTYDLKLPLSGLVRKHFKASDLPCMKKKNAHQ